MMPRYLIMLSCLCVCVGGGKKRLEVMIKLNGSVMQYMSIKIYLRGLHAWSANLKRCVMGVGLN